MCHRSARPKPWLSALPHTHHNGVASRVEIQDKGGTVPVLITEDVSARLDTLLKRRSVFVTKNNEYLFAKAAEYSHFCGSDVLRQFAKWC